MLNCRNLRNPPYIAQFVCATENTEEKNVLRSDEVLKSVIDKMN